MNNMDNEIEKTLSSLDNLTRATAPKELSAELLQKVRFLKNISDRWYDRLKYGVAAMIALAVVNGYVLFGSNWLTNTEESQIEALANEWYNDTDLIEYNYETE